MEGADEAQTCCRKGMTVSISSSPSKRPEFDRCPRALPRPRCQLHLPHPTPAKLANVCTKSHWSYFLIASEIWKHYWLRTEQIRKPTAAR
jgi:hypothetical protein